MNEMLLAGKSIKAPPSIYGPGPQTIIQGDSNFGYFGTVPDSVIKMGVLLRGIPTITTNYFTDSPSNVWLKFIRKGKVIFVPCFGFGLANSVSLVTNKMYYDALLPATARPNLPFIGQPGYTMNRTFTLSDGSVVYVSNPNQGDGLKTVSYVGAYPQDAVQPGEFMDLFMKPYADAYATTSPVRIPREIFAPFHGGDGRSGQIFLQCMNNNNSTLACTVTRVTYTARFGWYEGAAPSTNKEWCPVLRLVPPDEVPNLPT